MTKPYVPSRSDNFSRIFPLPLFRSILGICLCMIMGMAHLHSQQSTSPLVLNLVVPISAPDGSRELAMDRYPRFHVQLINISDQPVRIWKDWNSWGWFNLSFSYRTRSGTVQAITHLSPGHWEGDFPDFWILRPNEMVILEVDMTTAEWQGFPDLYGEKIRATLTATYENKTDPLADAYQVWVGSLVSNPVEVILK